MTVRRCNHFNLSVYFVHFYRSLGLIKKCVLSISPKRGVPWRTYHGWPAILDFFFLNARQHLRSLQRLVSFAFEWFFCGSIDFRSMITASSGVFPVWDRWLFEGSVRFMRKKAFIFFFDGVEAVPTACFEFSLRGPRLPISHSQLKLFMIYISWKAEIKPKIIKLINYLFQLRELWHLLKTFQKPL